MTSRLFLSHSSLDDFEAIALGRWLAEAGWDDVFLDTDPDRGIAPGQRWERELHAAALRCEAVIFLISAHWLASGWCRKEYELARRLNKTLFAVLIDPALPLADVPPEFKDTWQAVSIVGGQDGTLLRVTQPASHHERHVVFSRDGLRRLRRGLEQAGLDPRHFAWPPTSEPDRTPYRGLNPLEAVDAGVFFGREAQIIDAIGRLRALREGAAPRLFVILGASGAGKSSFLRAGLLPRLARDDRAFVALAPIRPERAALTGPAGLLGALESAFPQRTRLSLRAAIEAGAPGLRSLLKTLLAAPDDTVAAPVPTVVIAIDQAEELFRADGAAESEALLRLLRDLAIADDPGVLVVFAIRSDSYDALEHARALEGLPQAAFALLPMPRTTYKDVIEGPPRRVTEAGGRLDVEPQLTLRLLAETAEGEASDALPLLAFTLEQLYREVHQQEALRLADHQAMGGLAASFDRAVERVFARADADDRIPKSRDARQRLLRRGLIPWLAGIDPVSRSPRRNQARRADIPPEAAPLIDLLVEERLLVTDTRMIGAEAERVVTIEPAHEALLRQWGLLKGWLAEDFGLLAALEGAQRAARDWHANLRADPWLAHRGDRLAEAEALDTRADIAAKLDAVDRSYLGSCRDREDEIAAEAERTLKAQVKAHRLMVAGLSIALIFAVLAGIAGYRFQSQKTLVEVQKRLAEYQKRESLSKQRQLEANEKSGRNDLLGAASTALEGFRLLPSGQSRSSLLETLLALSPHLSGLVSAQVAANASALAWLPKGSLAVTEARDRLHLVTFGGTTNKTVEVPPAVFDSITIN